MKISPLKAVTPEAAENLADRLYAMTPNARITSLLAAGASLDRIRQPFHPSANRSAR